MLFTDIVGYSRLPMDQQTRLLRQLQDIVRSTREFQDAISRDQLISLPTGDGMALVFFGSPEDPVRCALDISRALGAQPELKLRMGVHSGPVYRVADINASLNVAGGAINMAQRVMDCGDAGHILVSDAIATTLEQLGTWGAQLHDLGETEVKHGTRVHIYNLFTEDIGNAELPAKFRTASRRRRRTSIVVGVVIVAGILALGAAYVLRPEWFTNRPRGAQADCDAPDTQVRRGSWVSELNGQTWCELALGGSRTVSEHGTCRGRKNACCFR